MTASSRALTERRRIPPFGFVGPFADGQPFGDAGIVKMLPSAVTAGGTVTIAHGLGRVPVWVQTLVNGTPGYPARCFFVSATSTSAVVQFDTAMPANTSYIALT